jgi:hypothetical protein
MVLPGSQSALADLLAKADSEGRPLRIKLGVDPTSADLHLGHAVVLRALKRFQDAGHQIILLIGGFTATIGDPTGRDVTRPALTSEQVAANAKTYPEQAGKVIDLARTEVVNNNDWLGAMSAAQLVSLTSMVTVNQLLAKDSFGTRIEKQQSVAVHELLYPVLQGHSEWRADIMGGSTRQCNASCFRAAAGAVDAEGAVVPGKSPAIGRVMRDDMFAYAHRTTRSCAGSSWLPQPVSATSARWPAYFLRVSIPKR